MTIRALQKSDYDQWLPLWEANCLHQIGEDVTAETWRRLCHPKEPVGGLGVWEGDKIAAIMHYILHPVTGSIEPVCYMQDLYVDPAFRRQGMARRLVWELADLGKKERWARIYWLAESANDAAQKLYKNLGIKVDFTLHILPTGTENT